MKSTTTMTTNELQTALTDLHALLAKGMFLEAMEKYLDDDVVMQEGEGDLKRGKKFNMDLEAKVLEGVGAFGGYSVSNVGFGENTTFYEAVMEYTQTDGKEVRVVQCVVDTWRDGKIVSERFYHA